MPTPIEKHRTWCKRCLDFKVHKWIKIDFSNALICETCGSEDNGYSISEVPEDKLILQRERYKLQKGKKLLGILGIYKDATNNIFNEIPVPNIIECDAGQKQIDKRNSKLREDHKSKLYELQIDFNENYSKLNRNDKCSCGSGKKFKQCHLIYFKNNGLNI